MEDQPTKKEEKHKSDDEIDLIALAKTVWQGRRIIIRTVVVCSVIGLIIALVSPKEFTASTTLVPQTSSGKTNLGGLSSLASMAGFNLDLSQGADVLSPQIYPQIVQSVPFQLEIMNTPFSFPKVEGKMTLYKYYTEVQKPGVLSVIKKYTLGLPGMIIKAIKGEKNVTGPNRSNETMIRLTEEQEEVRKIIDKNISLSINDKEGYVELSSNFFDSELAAQVTQKAKELLQKTITEFKIEKATAQLQFIEERYNEKKKEFEEAQEKLAAFRDRNKNVTSAVALTQEEQLQNEYQLVFNVYSELAKQLEQAQIKVKEDTPVFSTIKPVIIPIEKSKPNRPLILIIWIFLGLLVSITKILGQQYIVVLKSYWNNLK